MRINRKKAEETNLWLDRESYFLLHADHTTGKVLVDYNLKKYIDNKGDNMKELLKKNKNILLILIDIMVIISCYVVAMLFLNTKINNLQNFMIDMVIVVIVYQIFLNCFRMYQNMIRYEVGKDYVKYIISASLSVVILTLIDKGFNLEYINLRVNVLSGILTAGTFVMYRLLGRSIAARKMSKYEKINKNQDNKANNLLIIGAGMGAREIIIAIKNNMRDKYNIIGIIDDDISKINHYILGVKVLGTRYDIPKIAKEKNVDLIFFAINKIDAISRRKILEICQETGVKTRVLPTTEEVITKHGAMNSLRDVQIEDLLGREPVHLDNKNINSLIKNKTVLVTGGGGSIGSELCRQIVKYDPKRLVILDIYENNLYDIEMELRSEYPKLNLEAIVASVRDKARLNNVFETYKPEIVFHAAAHKHVPLMEKSPLEAIKNNVFGTYNVVNCADEYGVEKFVLISTDKAVNPTNIMGASKRVWEKIVQAKNKVNKTEILLNSYYFLNKDILSKGLKENWYPNNASYESLIAHELGHYITFVTLLKQNNIDYITLVTKDNINNYLNILNILKEETYSKELVEEAIESYNKKYNTNISLEDFTKSISGYASQKVKENVNYDEVIAEAIHDYYLHRDSSSTSSLEIINIIKERLQQWKNA